MRRFLSASALVFALLGFAPLIAQPVLAASTNLETSSSHCTVNGETVDCAEVGKAVGGALGAGIGFLVFIGLFFVVAIAATVFWIVMLVHAASHPIENQAMWIILMVFTGVLGAIIYFFVVKQKYVETTAKPKKA